METIRDLQACGKPWSAIQQSRLYPSGLHLKLLAPIPKLEPFPPGRVLGLSH